MSAPRGLLLRQVIWHAFEAHADGVIEFYIDANADLLSWATEQRWIRHISYYHRAIPIRIIQTARTCQKLMAQNLSPPPKPAITISVYPHPDVLAPDVRHLFDKAEKDHVELGVAWFRNLVDCVYPGQGAVSIYVLRKNGQPIAALPMRAETTSKTRQVHSLSNYYSALFAPALAPTIRPEDLAKLILSIRHNGARPASLRFAPMDPESSGFRTLEAALKLAGFPTFRFFCFGNG